MRGLTPVETPESQMNIHMHSTLHQDQNQLSFNSREIQLMPKSDLEPCKEERNVAASSSSNADASPLPLQSAAEVSNRSIVYLSSSPKKKM